MECSTIFFPGSNGHHILQLFHLSSLLPWCDAADHHQDCLAHAGHHGDISCRVSLGRWKYFRRTGNVITLLSAFPVGIM